MTDPDAFKATFTRNFRFAKHVTWAQAALSVLFAIAVIGHRQEWVFPLYLAVMACTAVGAFAMHRGKRLLDARLAEIEADEIVTCPNPSMKTKAKTTVP